MRCRLQASGYGDCRRRFDVCLCQYRQWLHRTCKDSYMKASDDYAVLRERLKGSSRRWLITGVAGFIGSNLLETLLRLDQEVVGLDNFSTGHAHNLDSVSKNVTPDQWNRFHMITGDIRELAVAGKHATLSIMSCTRRHSGPSPGRSRIHCAPMTVTSMVFSICWCAPGMPG